MTDMPDVIYVGLVSNNGLVSGSTPFDDAVKYVRAPAVCTKGEAADGKRKKAFEWFQKFITDPNSARYENLIGCHHYEQRQTIIAALQSPPAAQGCQKLVEALKAAREFSDIIFEDRFQERRTRLDAIEIRDKIDQALADHADQFVTRTKMVARQAIMPDAEERN